MNWIRIAVGIMRDPSIIALSEAVGVSVPTTTGHVVGVLTCLPEGSKTGDISGVSDGTLEAWAMWRGKRGAFASAFRAQLCDAQGVVRSWEKHNGAAIREVDKARDRMQAKRAEWKASAERSANVPRTKPERSHVHNETRRDETNNNNKPLAVTADAARPAAKFPAFPKALCDAAYEVWLAEMGSAEYSLFRKAFGPLFQRREEERPTSLARDAEFVPAVRLYVAAVIGTPEARFATPKKCAESLTRIVEALREGKTAEDRLVLAQWAIGTGQRPPLKVSA